MLEAIRSFFSSQIDVPEETGAETDPVDARVAACALLLELAYADDDFSEAERRHLEGCIRRQFGIDEERAARLIELASREQKESVDLYQFTRLIDREFSLGQKMVLAEAMWGLAYADGALASREDYLLRKISNLLHLEPGYLSEARDRVVDRLGKRKREKEGNAEKLD